MALGQASAHPAANNAEHICAQVQPLSATCGTHQIGAFRALGRRSLRWAPEQHRQQPKTTDYQHSLPGMTLATGLVERHQKAHHKLQSL